MVLKRKKPDEHPGVKFPMGRLVMTAGILNAFTPDQYGEVTDCLYRHLRGDWGILDKDDVSLNDAQIEMGGQLLSAYVVHGKKFYIITDPDRSVTTILLPDEY